MMMGATRNLHSQTRQRELASLAGKVSSPRRVLGTFSLRLTFVVIRLFWADQKKSSLSRPIDFQRKVPTKRIRRKRGSSDFSAEKASKKKANSLCTVCAFLFVLLVPVFRYISCAFEPFSGRIWFRSKIADEKFAISVWLKIFQGACCDKWKFYSGSRFIFSTLILDCYWRSFPRPVLFFFCSNLPAGGIPNFSCKAEPRTGRTLEEWRRTKI